MLKINTVRANRHAAWLWIAAGLIVLTACTSATNPLPPAAPSATAVPATAAPAMETPTTAVAVLPPTFTPTSAPSTPTTPPATETPAPSPTQAPTLGAAENGLGVWCLPEGYSLAAASDPFAPPADARVGALEKGALEVHNLPVTACVVTYTFNQPAPTGLKLEVFEQANKKPWLTADLLPVKDKPASVSAVLRHSYIIAPPLWNVSYFFAVADANGNELQRVPVNLHRWTPWICWNGRPPNPLTLRCPLPLDLHPWDAGYGTPIPVLTPGR